MLEPFLVGLICPPLQAILDDPQHHDYLAILKSTRNSFVYGVEVRFPHALALAISFSSRECVHQWPTRDDHRGEWLTACIVHWTCCQQWDKFQPAGGSCQCQRWGEPDQYEPEASTYANSFVYGVKVRLPHVLVLAISFDSREFVHQWATRDGHRGEWLTAYVVRWTCCQHRQHAPSDTPLSRCNS